MKNQIVKNDPNELDVSNLSFEEKERLAEDPDTSPDILILLAEDKNDIVRFHVARNSNTPLEILTNLAKDSRINGAVAENPNTPPELLIQLASSKSSITRYMVARNLKTPPETLAILAKDEDNVVSEKANQTISLINASQDESLKGIVL